MNEEEDFSDLPFDTYFVDKRCKELEKVMRENPEFTGYEVIRKSWGKDWKLDPFFIQNEDGENLIFLEPEIVDALSDSEFRAYIDVQIKHIGCYEETFWFLIATLVLTPAIILSPIMALFLFPNIDIRVVGISLILYPIFLIPGIIYYRKRNRMISKKRHIDLVEAQENSMFLSALRKLVSIPNLDYGTEYRMRLQYIEDTLEGVNS